MKPFPATRPYAEVIGDPISHSKSPAIHNFWLEKSGITADYRAAHVTPEALADYIAERRMDSNWRGCNVTLPHKIAVMDLVEDPGNVRATIGAMNTVLNIPQHLIGTNTDAAGFYAPLAESNLEGADVTVIGTGGAAHAILFALSRCSVGTVTLMARNVLKGAALLSRFNLKGKAIPLSPKVQPTHLLVNASALGMSGESSPDWDLSSLAHDACVYDIVYKPLTTPLLAAAEGRGLETIDGLEMLVGQAAAAFELFFGAPAPREYDAELRAALLA